MLKHIIFITFWGLIPEITKFTQWAYYNVELKFYMLETYLGIISIGNSVYKVRSQKLTQFCIFIHSRATIFCIVKTQN